MPHWTLISFIDTKSCMKGVICYLFLYQLTNEPSLSGYCHLARCDFAKAMKQRLIALDLC